VTDSTPAVPGPELAEELDDEPYNPATGHLEPRVTEFHDDADGSVAARAPQEDDAFDDDDDEEAYNPATGHIEGRHTRAVEDPS
jgi:hypothetical protein